MLESKVEAVAQSWSIKNKFWKISKNLLENTCDRVTKKRCHRKWLRYMNPSFICNISKDTHFLGDCPFCFKQILFIIALYLLNENVTTEMNLSRMKITFKICTHLVTFIRYLILNCISFGNVLRDNTKIYHISPEILFNLFY